MIHEELTRHRFADLADRAYRTNQYTFTAFLTEAELSEFLALRQSLAPSGYTLWGGHENAERVMIRFGDPESYGYEEPFPIRCVRIAPLQQKFADALTHRDFLGAVMHLGIKRSEIGDILVEDKSAWLFCTETMADYLCRELTRIRHTSVSAAVTEMLPETFAQKTTEGQVQVASERADGVVAKIFRISRGDCLVLFRAGKIFVNGRCVENNSLLLKEGDKVSVRGYGKFRFLGIGGLTRKGSKIVRYERFSG